MLNDGLGGQRYIFKPEIKDKKCKHKWTKLTNKGKGSSWFFFISNKIEVEFDYLYCEKCGSTAGEEIRQ